MQALKRRWKVKGTLTERRAWNAVARTLRGGVDPVEFETLYRSDTESSCYHPFYGPTLTSIAPYVGRFYRRVVKRDRTMFRLFPLDQTFLAMLAMDKTYGPYFASARLDDEGVFIQNENREWERMSENSKLDCEFFERLFREYQEMLEAFDGVYTTGGSGDECVLWSNQGTTYSIVRKVSNTKPKRKSTYTATSSTKKRKLWFQ